MEEKIISRRKFLKLAGIASSGAVLAACGPSAQQPAAAPAAEQPAAAAPEATTAAPAAEGEKLVRLWVNWGNMNQLFQDEAWYKMPEYQEICKDIKIEYKGNVTDANTMTAIAAGEPPDCGSNLNYAQLAIKDVFIDTEPYIQASQYIKQEDYIPAIWDFCKFWTFNGFLGLPCFESFLDYGLNYNTELVTKAGLDPNAPPSTWSEAFAWHEALTVKDMRQPQAVRPRPVRRDGRRPRRHASRHQPQVLGRRDRQVRLHERAIRRVLRRHPQVLRRHGRDQVAGLRQARHGRLGPLLQRRGPGHDHRGLLAPGETNAQALRSRRRTPRPGRRYSTA